MTAQTAQKKYSSNNQQWFHCYADINSPGKWIYNADATFRWMNWLENSSSYLVRAGVGYKLGSSYFVGSGFAFAGTYKLNKIYRYEYRPYADLIQNNKFKHFSVQLRLRIEERIFVETATNVLSSNLRYRIRSQFAIPLYKSKKEEKHFAVSFLLADEIFINQGKHIVYNVFDQNRVIAGINTQLSSALICFVNYNYQYASSNKSNTYTLSHIIWTGFRYSLSLQRKTEN